MLRCSLFASLLLVLSLGAGADDPAGLKVAIQPKAIAPHTFFVQGLPGVASAENQGFNSNAAFVVTDEGVVVVDVLGTPVSVSTFDAALGMVSAMVERRAG